MEIKIGHYTAKVNPKERIINVYFPKMDVEYSFNSNYFLNGDFDDIIKNPERYEIVLIEDAGFFLRKKEGLN